MSLVNEAKWLFGDGYADAPIDEGQCLYGCIRMRGLGHPPKCSAHDIPKILAALEAAERLVEDGIFFGMNLDRDGVCGSCGSQEGHAHRPGCRYQALVVALKGVTE